MDGVRFDLGRPREQKIVGKEGNPVLVRWGKTFSGWAVAVLGLLAFGPPIAAADTIRISGTGGAIGTIRFLGEAFRKVRPDVRIVTLPGMGSNGAVKAVLDGRLDIGLSGRALTEEERAAGAVEFRYARTPFVFGVNRTVEKTGLTLAEVAEIYGGKRDWERGRRIRLILRPPTDSDIPVLKSFSREIAAAVESALRREGMIIAMTDQEAADDIEKIPGAFGGTTLSLVISEKRAIRVLALDGTVPSVGALADRSYRYGKTFRMVTRKNPRAAVLQFIDFVRSPAGAAVLGKNGQAATK
jgi:phosphate transport system substrate-binding protein